MAKRIKLGFEKAGSLEPEARCFLAGVFIVAAILKIGAPRDMLAAIQGFRVVNPLWALFGSYFLPWLEFWSGLGLLWKQTRRAAALMLCALMLLFVAMILQAWLRGISLECGCFGFYPQSGQDSYPVLLLRDAAIVILAGYVFWFSGKTKNAKFKP